MTFVITFNVIPEHDVVVPPFSSKLARSILAFISPSYKQVMEDDRPHKPVRVTTLKDHQGRPVFSRWDKKSTLKGNEQYTFSFTFRDDNILSEVISSPSTSVELWSTKFRAEVADFKAVGEYGMEDSRYYYVRFMTPTMLQPPKPPFKKRKNRYVLFPYVPLLLNSIYQHWLKNEGEVIKGVTGLRTLYYLRETAYNLTPVKAIYDGKPVKGFVGWVIYEFTARRGSKLRENVLRLLSYANYYGVGKSRAIGFGEVVVRPSVRGGDSDQTKVREDGQS
ncbi:CRISPR-associated endoribonuclease Cas6 [Stygiolobus caldivivus]|uniref:CRISPR-associated endoribonuclease Cas6 n=1 Tax=Stygiolobus caldivivus TaxID=2824673 RepID=A0A8D5U6E3_9CREN|nr:CRISPR-associated endoribonuclease Cas6 [Stygiolobus caldivivus]BCU69920.1 CRISPR-associated endoribonuclease Cas6 [Stygiolobus caldivivus]